jgi:radical SAM protein with 4Fe4S-binding SPASM domain
MSNNTSKLPALLRNETFGGILFEPAEGALIELDHEAFDAIVQYFEHPDRSATEEARPIIETISRQMENRPHRNYRRIKHALNNLKNYDFLVYSAPNLVDFQITSQCYMGCRHCYASSSPSGGYVPMDDIEIVLKQCHECGVSQIALGGGEPLLHPDLEQIFKRCHHYGIVPNLTTNGMHLDETILALLKTYCGAAALSLEGVGQHYSKWRHHGFKILENGVQQLKKCDIPTVLQITLSANNIHKLDQIAQYCLTHPHLYGVIFLAYKPVGRGASFGGVLAGIPPDRVSERLRSAFLVLSEKMRVGYDCCMAPAIAGTDASLEFADENYIEGCSAFRGSIGISTDLNAIPCTFLPGENAGNLKERSLQDIWTGRAADLFRKTVYQRIDQNDICRTCKKRVMCLGGCPRMDLVNCHKNYLSDNCTRKSEYV